VEDEKGYFMKKLLFLCLMGLCLAGCVDKVGNFLTETKKATPKYTKLGRVNNGAPILKEPKKPAFSIFEKREKQKELEQEKKLNPKFDMVGYVVLVQKDRDVNLYVYSFTDALRTKRLQFYTREKLPYKPHELVRVNIQDNFLKSHQRYRSVTGKRGFNHYIQAAKEYIIRF